MIVSVFVGSVYSPHFTIKISLAFIHMHMMPAAREFCTLQITRAFEIYGADYLAFSFSYQLDFLFGGCGKLERNTSFPVRRLFFELAN